MVEVARSWIDTRVKYMGRVKGRGVDCLGLAMLTGIEAGVLVDPRDAAGAEPWGKYGHLPDSALMSRFVHSVLVPLPGDPEPGDVGFFCWGSFTDPVHLAVMGEFEGRLTMIHAHFRTQPRRAREHTYDSEWVARNKGFFRYPGLC